MVGNDPKAVALHVEITKQGDFVRALKAKKAEKTTVDFEVKKLLDLKSQYEKLAGTPYVAPASKDSKSKEKADKPKEAKKEAKPKEKV
ncbi:hypothetical protein O3G_MSEX000880 [Manduca sexta]|nr:hypothetical protein O3G_MSEX000880 [Manduca sexta]